MPTNETTQHAMNSAAYGRLKPEIDRSYPAGQFVAIYDGRIQADAPTFEELHRLLSSIIEHPERAFIIQAGVDYPKQGIIFTQHSVAL